jgi:hypothetical protein
MIHVESMMDPAREKNPTTIQMDGGVEQALKLAPVAVPHHALHQTLVVGKLHLYHRVPL